MQQWPHEYRVLPQMKQGNGALRTSPWHSLNKRLVVSWSPLLLRTGHDQYNVLLRKTLQSGCCGSDMMP